eukprot:767603-Hanusia_phi.AAC.3
MMGLDAYSYPSMNDNGGTSLLRMVMQASKEKRRLVLHPGMHTIREEAEVGDEGVKSTVVKHDMDYDVFKDYCKRMFPENQTLDEKTNDLLDLLDSEAPNSTASAPLREADVLEGREQREQGVKDSLRHLPGVLSSSCFLPPSSELLLRGNSSDQGMAHVEGSWKMVHGSQGTVEDVCFSNMLGSIFEILSGRWDFQSCQFATAGPWLVGPVCIFGSGVAVIEMADCRQGAL